MTLQETGIRAGIVDVFVAAENITWRIQVLNADRYPAGGPE